MWNGVAAKFIQNNKKMLMDNNAGEKPALSGFKWLNRAG